MPVDVEDFRRKMQPLLAKFETDVGYTGFVAGNHQEVLDEMHLQAACTGIPYTKDSTSLNQFIAAVNYATFGYSSLPLHVRVYIGILNWLAITIDDQAGKDPDEWIQFAPRYHAAAKHPNNATAQAFDNYLRRTYQYYPTVVANYIVADAIRFVNATCIERDVAQITRTAGGQKHAETLQNTAVSHDISLIDPSKLQWPDYYRTMNAFAEGSVLLLFPKEVCPDMSRFIECLPDMMLYVGLANDVLSLYKEECKAEKDNYLHTRAHYDGVGTIEVWETVAREVVDAHRRVQAVLEGRSPYGQLWNDWAMGYIKYHKISARYRLHELGLGDSSPEN
ncbi:isoprenoid synthase domain-containing protein [Xylaria venustula]|nr:isoprenoid synthase domain-containing protein [Xylaria venustula]